MGRPLPEAQLVDARFTDALVTGTNTNVRTGVAPCPNGTRAFAGGGFFRAPDGTLAPSLSMV